jgi:hypothetical protein
MNNQYKCRKCIGYYRHLKNKAIFEKVLHVNILALHSNVILWNVHVLKITNFTSILLKTSFIDI